MEKIMVAQVDDRARSGRSLDRRELRANSCCVANQYLFSRVVGRERHMKILVYLQHAAHAEG